MQNTTRARTDSHLHVPRFFRNAVRPAAIWPIARRFFRLRLIAAHLH
jgi:hypothetical protein